MSDVSIIYLILGLVFVYLLIMIPVNINQTRIYTRNMMREMEALHKTVLDLSKNLNLLVQTREDIPFVQCSWCKESVPESDIQRFGDVSLCPACAEKGGRKGIGIGKK